MGAMELLKLAVTHPDELRSVLNRQLWHEPKVLEDDPEATRVREPKMKRCWELLDLTSRSFAMVIRELDGDLCRFICLFYLVLRGLDTVEDDMTLDITLKEEILLSFHERLTERGWTFTGSGPNEKDRQLLVEFDVVIDELLVLDSSFQDVIKDIARKMGAGMAKFARLYHDNKGVHSVNTCEDFDLYCHYVAGLVGEGLSRLFAKSGKEMPELGDLLELSNSMGLFLQKTNILRDFREDLDDGRMFWPKEIWGKYAEHPSELALPRNVTLARYALSEMTVDALRHATDVLDYLSLLRNQSVFNFCAIPQLMAIATLDACFGNLAVFHRNVKIRRSLTVHLISKASNPRDLAYLFVTIAKRMHARATPDDPSFLKLSVAVSQIIQWAETRYPSWISLGGPAPMYRDQPEAAGVYDVRLLQQPAKSPSAAGGGPAGPGTAAQTKPGFDDFKFMVIILGAVAGVMIFSFAAIIGGVYFFLPAQFKAITTE